MSALDGLTVGEAFVIGLLAGAALVLWFWAGSSAWDRRPAPKPRGESTSERHARLDAEARDQIEMRRTKCTSSNRKSGRSS